MVDAGCLFSVTDRKSISVMQRILVGGRVKSGRDGRRRRGGGSGQPARGKSPGWAGGGAGRRGGCPPPAASRRPQAGSHPGRAAAGDQGPTGQGGLPEREAHLYPARGPGAHLRPAGRGGEAHPAAVGLRNILGPQRRRNSGRVLRGPQDAGCAPSGDRGRGAEPGSRGGVERIAERRAVPGRRWHRRSGHHQRGAERRPAGPHRRSGRRGAGGGAGHRADRSAAEERRHRVDGLPLGTARRAPAPARGGTPRARGSSRRHL